MVAFTKCHYFWASSCGGRSRWRCVAGALDSLPLSCRERKAYLLLISGYSRPEIAEMLGVSRHTKVAHCRNIYAKLNEHNRAGLEAEVFSNSRAGEKTSLQCQWGANSCGSNRRVRRAIAPIAIRSGYGAIPPAQRPGTPLRCCKKSSIARISLSTPRARLTLKNSLAISDSALASGAVNSCQLQGGVR